MAAREAVESPRTAPRRPAAAKDGGADLLSPRFRSAAALAGWDEESILLAALVVEDTPVRESRRKRRPSSAGGSCSAGSNARKRRSRRQSPGAIPPVVLALDDEEKPDGTPVGSKEVKKEEEEEENVFVEKAASGSIEKAAEVIGELPCMERLREELSCAICLEICFEPSTTPCGHSFCMKCLKHAASKCGKRCPKCRQLISNSRTCTVNTVLWNTIQLLFPSEVEARRTSIAASSASNDDVKQSPPISTSFRQSSMRSRSTRGSYNTQDNTSSSSSSRNFITRGTRRSMSMGSGLITQNSGTRTTDGSRGFVRASQLVTTRRGSVESDQSDAALAYRLQQGEFMTAFESSDAERQPPRNTVSTARENLRAMASRAIRLRARGWPV